MGKKIESFADLRKALSEKENNKGQEASPPARSTLALAGKVSARAGLPVPGQAGSGAAKTEPAKGPSPRPVSKKVVAQDWMAQPDDVYRPKPEKNALTSAQKPVEKNTPEARTGRRIADAGELAIEGTKITRFISAEIPERWESAQGAASDVAIIGLDFGTAFTKVVVSWMGERGVVDWGQDGTGQAAYWVSSTFKRGQHGPELSDGVHRNGAEVTAIKMRLMASEVAEEAASAAIADAVDFLGLVLTHVVGWTLRWVAERRGDVSNWVVNIGFPAKAHQEPALLKRYQAAATKAWQIVTQNGGVRADWQQAQIYVIPEFAAQLYGYLKDQHKERDSHLLVDVGAGTADLVAFIPHVENGRNVTPILSSSIKRLGAHKLLAARVGSLGRDKAWCDTDVHAASAELSNRCGESDTNIDNATADFSRTFSNAVSGLIAGAKTINPLCVNLKPNGGIPTFLCGGGGKAQFYRDAVLRADRRIRVRDFPAPEDLQWSGDKAFFHRVSVAYGLSFSRRNMGEIIDTAHLELIAPMPTREIEHRDASR